LVRTSIFTLAFFSLQISFKSVARRREVFHEELAQSVGNEKIPGDFDWDAATAVDPGSVADRCKRLFRI